MYPIKDECVGFTVISKEKDFSISQYPLLQTEFLYDSILGMPIIIFWLFVSLNQGPWSSETFFKVILLTFKVGRYGGAYHIIREPVSQMDLKSIERL